MKTLKRGKAPQEKVKLRVQGFTKALKTKLPCLLPLTCRAPAGTQCPQHQTRPPLGCWAQTEIGKFPVGLENTAAGPGGVAWGPHPSPIAQFFPPRCCDPYYVGALVLWQWTQHPDLIFFGNIFFCFVAVLGLHCCSRAYLIAERGLLSSGGARASGCHGFPCYGLQGAQASVVEVHGLNCLQHVGSSRPRDRTHVLCVGRQILNHWSTREVLRDLVFTPVQHAVAQIPVTSLVLSAPTSPLIRDVLPILAFLFLSRTELVPAPGALFPVVRSPHGPPCPHSAFSPMGTFSKWSYCLSHCQPVFFLALSFWRRGWQPTPVILAWEIPGTEDLAGYGP